MKRRTRVVVGGFLAGSLAFGAALAGAVVAQVAPPLSLFGKGGTVKGLDADEIRRAIGLTAGSSVTPGDAEISPDRIPVVAGAQVKAPKTGKVPAGTFLVGASRASLYPTPTAFGGQTWMTEGCTIWGVDDPSTFNVRQEDMLPPVNPDDPNGTADEIRSWPASSPDCIYLGGFGLGPVRPAGRVGNGGVWVRAIAISNGEETFIYEIADAVGWFARYDPTICSDCGILDVRERLATDLGVDVGDVVVASTHGHATADTYGGWGGIPDWYRNQIRDAAIAAAKQAVANLESATLTVGEVHLRNRNSERRDTYYSNADTGATWVQAKALPREVCQGKGKKETCTITEPVIGTWATYAGHATIVGDPILHADWPGAAARRFEASYGGVGLVFEGGLGNVSVSGVGGNGDEQSAENTGIAIANDISGDIVRNAHLLDSNDMTAAVQEITHPTMTNPGIVTLAAVGLFDREFIPGTKGAGLPGAYHWSKKGEMSSSGEDNDVEPAGEVLRGCSSAGPTVITTAGAHRIGGLVVALVPGEPFSTLAEVVKEKADRTVVTMVVGLANDALGYVPQSIEFDTLANVITEYGVPIGEYEEVFAIDRCFGDHVLETLLESTAALGAGR